MASSLHGLMRTLTWGDFPRRPGHTPAPGQAVVAAETNASFSVSASSVRPVAGTRPVQFRLQDNITVRVVFERNRSFAMSWMFGRPPQFQADMLNHDTGALQLHGAGVP